MRWDGYGYNVKHPHFWGEVLNIVKVDQYYIKSYDYGLSIRFLNRFTSVFVIKLWPGKVSTSGKLPHYIKQFGYQDMLSIIKDDKYYKSHGL